MQAKLSVNLLEAHRYSIFIRFFSKLSKVDGGIGRPNAPASGSFEIYPTQTRTGEKVGTVENRGKNAGSD